MCFSSTFLTLCSSHDCTAHSIFVIFISLDHPRCRQHHPGPQRHGRGAQQVPHRGGVNAKLGAVVVSLSAALCPPLSSACCCWVDRPIYLWFVWILSSLFHILTG